MKDIKVLLKKRVKKTVGLLKAMEREGRRRYGEDVTLPKSEKESLTRWEAPSL